MQTLSRQQRQGRQIHWLGTLTACCNQPHLTELCFKQPRWAAQVWQLILLDASASVLQNQQATLAQMYLSQIAKQAYLDRHQLQLMAFSNNQVLSVFAKQRLPKEFSSVLSRLRFGGGTPFQQGLIEVERVAKKIRRRHQQAIIELSIVTDGRINEQVTPLSALDSCRIIDVEQGAMRFGRSQQLAQQLQAEYVRG